MLIGHLGVGMALKTWASKGAGKRGARPSPNLGVWFAAVLFADLACFIFNLVGLEKFEYAPGFVRNFPYRLVHAPYSHSLAGAVFFGAVTALGAWLGRFPTRVALLLGVAVFSHFPLDLPVHGPDMAWAFEPPSLGFSLWNHPWVSETLELFLLAGGTVLLVRAEPRLWGRPFRIFLIGLLTAQALPSLVPPIENPWVAAWSGLLSMSLLVAWGGWGGR